jgi:hypothetical protein
VAPQPNLGAALAVAAALLTVLVLPLLLGSPIVS